MKQPRLCLKYPLLVGKQRQVGGQIVIIREASGCILRDIQAIDIGGTTFIDEKIDIFSISAPLWTVWAGQSKIGDGWGKGIVINFIRQRLDLAAFAPDKIQALVTNISFAHILIGNQDHALTIGRPRIAGYLQGSISNAASISRLVVDQPQVGDHGAVSIFVSI